METIRSATSTPYKHALAYAHIDAPNRIHKVVAATWKARLTYIIRFEAKKIFTAKEQVTERLAFSRCFDSISSERGGNDVDGLMPAMKGKRLEVSITAASKAQAAAQFKANKPRTCRPDKPNDKPDKNKAKPKDRTGGRPLPSTDKVLLIHVHPEWHEGG
jgi:hypothetical protein